MKPKDYLEFNYEGVTICMSSVKQVMILFVPVGGTYMYSIFVVDRGSVGPLKEDDMTRSWAQGPGMVGANGAFDFYGKALKQARAVCGWIWEPHPDSHLVVKQEDLAEDARQALGAYEERDRDESLTASERNPSLTKRRWDYE